MEEENGRPRLQLQRKPPSSIMGYRITPGLENAFKGPSVKRIIRKTLKEILKGKVYNIDNVRTWTTDIADSVNNKIRDRISLPNYKYVVQVMLGQQMGAGCHYYEKCCWDTQTDAETSYTFTNASLFCICTVYGVYLY